MELLLGIPLVVVISLGVGITIDEKHPAVAAPLTWWFVGSIGGVLIGLMLAAIS